MSDDCCGVNPMLRDLNFNFNFNFLLIYLRHIEMKIKKYYLNESHSHN